MIRRLIIYIFCFGYLATLNAQETGGTKNYTDDNGFMQGYWEKTFPNGNIQYRGTFRDGHPVGELTRYFPGGSKMAVMIFCDEGRRSDTRLFYENGNLAAVGLYIGEKKDSVWKYYSFYDNHLTSSETYNNGVMEGLSSVYYPDGNLAETFWYENGLRNGQWNQYYENGKPRLKAEFLNGQRHGGFVFYSPEGRTEMEGRYYMNRMHGEWLFYEENGQVVSRITYIDGKPENEEELIEKEQEKFRKIEEMRGRIPEPDESELFSPGRY